MTTATAAELQNDWDHEREPYGNDGADNTGLPENKDYLERGLPQYLRSSIEHMNASWNIVDSGGKDSWWDLNWCELNADINSAEVEQEISSEQAWYLREKYLRMKREDNL